MLDDEIGQRGGQWVKLRAKKDGALEGDVINAESRGKTFEGAPVLGAKSGKQRQEWILTLQTERRESAEDDGIRKVALNERAQSALSEAVKAAGAKGLAKGGHLKIGVKEDPPSDREQGTYQARYAMPTFPVTNTDAPAEEAPPDYTDEPPF